ncbi:ABC transporter ATP-binding protein [Acidobacterium sp. S8]|uniref:ABC transporter ATP-binding protein n=1 Tax=Acidobacterium sp. S8 TaxID=1641854 RepID=UPI00131D48FB|nr:ABC transporter ATP-binding protein [Acidobacterium sp. S8]
MSDLAIETRSLYKHYRSLHAVDGLDMSVPRGSIYGFMGRNGAGKTTTIRMLAGLTHQTSGDIKILGLDPRTDRTQLLDRTGFVVDKMLLPSMTGDDLVRFNRGFFPRWSDALATKYADVLEIPMKQKFRKLSTGSQTKLCLLLALAQGAELLILDEPTAGLDPVVTDQLLRVLVDDFANEGRTLFLSSHHLSEVERVADWIGIIDQGKLLLEAPLDDVRSGFRRIRVIGEDLSLSRGEIFRTKKGEGATEYILRANAEAFIAELRSQGAAILDVAPMNLSEVFLEVVGKGEKHVPVEILA